MLTIHTTQIVFTHFRKTGPHLLSHDTPDRRCNVSRVRHDVEIEEEERGWRKWEVGIYIGILVKYSNAYSNETFNILDKALALRSQYGAITLLLPIEQVCI
jgi:hypothetical protein